MLPKNQVTVFSIAIIIGHLVFLFGCDLHLRGHKETGFEVELHTNVMNFDDIAKLESALTDKGFGIVWRERPIPTQDKPDRVITELSLLRKYRGEPHSILYTLIYERDTPNRQARDLRFVIGNWKHGGVIPELTAEINSISNLVYDYLSKLYGKESVSIEFRGDIVRKL